MTGMLRMLIIDRENNNSCKSDVMFMTDYNVNNFSHKVFYDSITPVLYPSVVFLCTLSGGRICFKIKLSQSKLYKSKNND